MKLASIHYSKIAARLLCLAIAFAYSCSKESIQPKNLQIGIEERSDMTLMSSEVRSLVSDYYSIPINSILSASYLKETGDGWYEYRYTIPGPISGSVFIICCDTETWFVDPD